MASMHDTHPLVRCTFQLGTMKRARSKREEMSNYLTAQRKAATKKA